MGRLMPAAMLSLVLIIPPACDDAADGGQAEPQEEAPAAEATGDDKYVLGGKARPAWLETLVLANESWSLSLTGTDAERAIKLALAAVDLAADHPLLLGYSELTIAFAELQFCFTDSLAKPSQSFTDAHASRYKFPPHTYLHETFMDLCERPAKKEHASVLSFCFCLFVNTPCR